MGNQREQFLQEVSLATQAGDTGVSKVAALIAKNEANVLGHSIYFAKATGGSTTTRMSEASDVKTIGISNIANSKLGPNQVLLCTSMRLLGVVLGATPTADTIKAANFGSIKNIAALQNAEMDVYSGGKLIMKDFPLANFLTDNRQTVETGTYVMPCPKFLYPDQEVKVEIRTGVNHDANTVIKVEFIGVGTAN